MTTELERVIDTLLLGGSSAMRRLRDDIMRFAPSPWPVLIHGQSGSGKELVAAAVHRVSGRTGAFVRFNICALGDTMFEDALFGHVKGAFTGAHGDTRGYLREANGGTVMLDEISGLPLSAQVKLLRAVETGVVRPIGGNLDHVSDFRIIAATNQDLHMLVETGEFRADLLHRLHALVITVPPLRDRREDVPMLARHFMQRDRGHRDMELSTEAMNVLLDYSWPGNVRELQHVLRRLILRVQGPIISRDDVVDAIARAKPSETAPVVKDERTLVLELLALYRGDVDAVARHIGCHRATVYRRMQRLGISSVRPATKLALLLPQEKTAPQVASR